VGSARYDGQTGWYESFAATALLSEARAAAVRLLGVGPGDCLDLGCGTGLAIPLLVEAGWSVTATDVSSDQLEAARENVGGLPARILEADAHALPFADGEFDVAVSILTHTDLDDPVAAWREVHRVLGPEGAFVYLGVHPCFGSPFVQRRDVERPILVPGYRNEGWQRLPPDEESAKIRARVGINHVTLAGLVSAFLAAGFAITALEEPGDDDPPFFLALRLTRSSR
jgi:SAM-dependent methyltransferase